MKYSDQPIVRPDQDVLGRSDFCLTLAESIDQLSIAADGFVMAVVGPWGIGKTSVIELSCRYLRHIEMSRLTSKPPADFFVEGPVALNDLERMAVSYDKVAHLLRDLENEGKDPSLWDINNQKHEFAKILDLDAEVSDASEYWRLLSRTNRSPRTIIVRFSPWLITGGTQLSAALLGELARALGPRLGGDIKRALSDLLARLAELAPLASSIASVAGAGVLGSIFDAGSTSSARVAERLTKGPTLDELREKLQSALRAIGNQRILVVVDDLDRLTPKETLQMISLVKSLGNMPNTIYLLSYDETRLNTSLVDAGVDGLNYVEKIVQYAVWVPPPPRGSILALLNIDLGAIFGEISQDDADELGTVWTAFLREYVRSPRDAKRLSNALAIPGSGLRSVTHIPDLVALEALRIFEPASYEYIRDNIDDFV